jgi:hypothetical protein
MTSWTTTNVQVLLDLGFAVAKHHMAHTITWGGNDETGWFTADFKDDDSAGAAATAFAGVLASHYDYEPTSREDGTDHLYTVKHGKFTFTAAWRESLVECVACHEKHDPVHPHQCVATGRASYCDGDAA